MEVKVLFISHVALPWLASQVKHKVSKESIDKLNQELWEHEEEMKKLVKKETNLFSISTCDHWLQFFAGAWYILVVQAT